MGRPAKYPLLAATKRSIAAADWITDADEALVALALGYAKQIDEAFLESPELGRKHQGWTGTHLLAALKALGLTPTEDKRLRIASRPSRRLAELRAQSEELRAGRGAAVLPIGGT